MSHFSPRSNQQLSNCNPNPLNWKKLKYGIVNLAQPLIGEFTGPRGEPTATTYVT